MTGYFFEEPAEQSQIKAKIVSEYFFVWAKVITSSPRSERIAYIDLFAGQGIYNEKTISTPIMVLEKAISDPKLAERLVTVFNDRDSNACDLLRHAIARVPGINSLKYPPRVLNLEVDSEVADIFQSLHLVPTLFFVDPWGYKGLSLDLVNAAIKDWACECVFFFNYNRINMALSNDAVRDHMDALFGKGADQLRKAIGSFDPHTRELAIVERLAEALNPGGSRFVLPFRFVRDGGRTSHHLIFVTKNFLGYDIMKEIMAKKSSGSQQGVATFEFNPADAQFPMLFEYSRPVDELKDMLITEFGGRTLTFEDLYKSHSVGRPFMRKHYRAVLKELEKAEKLTATKPGNQKRLRGTFPDNVLITFANGD